MLFGTKCNDQAVRVRNDNMWVVQKLQDTIKTKQELNTLDNNYSNTQLTNKKDS